MTSSTLLAGFLRPSEAAQSCFRAVLNAMAEPGIPQTLIAPQEAPEGCATGTASIGLSLLDISTRFYAQGLGTLAAYLRFHTSAPEAPASEAQWAFAASCSNALLSLAQQLSEGSLECPEAAATLVIQLREAPVHEGPMRIKGPGIQHERAICHMGLSNDFWSWRQAARARYPLGIDLLFVHEDQVWALPRSTELVMEAACTSQ
ncbi:MAG: hypothetical protein RJA77_462 [Pseudomonadota bacterium]